MTASAAAYLREAAKWLDTLMTGQEKAFEAATAAIAKAIADDKLIYLFGTGHSHILSEEGHFRAGGLACVVPILSTALMLHEGAVAGTKFERMSGMAEVVFSRYAVGPGDVLFVFSNSGVNAVPIEAARIGKARGATVIAISSEDYSRAAANGRPRLAELADIAIDNKAPPGDAIMPMTSDGLRAGPISTVVGAAILNALFVDAGQRCLAAGVDVPVYVSANVPGAMERNAALIERYGKRNPHL